jgi:phosphoenolpyruvate carboxykinase (diphosphate)
VLPITDLNNALVSYLLTELAGFSTPAGHIGPNIQVDHDISLLIPEIWCRLSPEERQPEHMIKHKLMEQIQDFEHNGETIPASRLGYRITSRFIRHYAGRVFENPNKVFDEAILKPETQSLDAFDDGVKYITEAHSRVAKDYFQDGSIDQACPPLKALLHIMVHGEFEGLGLDAPEIRTLFTLDSMLASDWYKARLETQQRRDIALWTRHVNTLSTFDDRPDSRRDATELDIAARLEKAKAELKRVSSAEYLADLSGQSGADPMGE